MASARCRLRSCASDRRRCRASCRVPWRRKAGGGGAPPASRVKRQVEPACQPGQERGRAGARVKVHLDMILAMLQRLPDILKDVQETFEEIVFLENVGQE